MKRSCLHVVTCLLLVGVFFGMADHIDFQPEDPCSSQGGLCVLSSECPDTKLAKGLCPKQQAQGAECCDKIPDSDKRCSFHGGECLKKCSALKPVTHQGLECPTGTACCVWGLGLGGEVLFK